MNRKKMQPVDSQRFFRNEVPKSGMPYGGNLPFADQGVQDARNPEIDVSQQVGLQKKSLGFGRAQCLSKLLKKAECTDKTDDIDQMNYKDFDNPMGIQVFSSFDEAVWFEEIKKPFDEKMDQVLKSAAEFKKFKK